MALANLKAMLRKFSATFVTAFIVVVSAQALSGSGFQNWRPRWAIRILEAAKSVSTPLSSSNRLGRAATAAQSTPGPGLLQSTDLAYLGAFRLPTTPLNDVVHTFNYMGDSNGVGMAYNPAGNGGQGSLLIPGMQLGGLIAEVGIPTTVNNGNVASLNTAPLLHDFVDPLAGHSSDIFPGYGSNYIGGLLLQGGHLIVTVFPYFDLSADSHPASHFVASADLDHPAVLAGPYQVGPTGDAGWVDGAMAAIPAAYQAALGGPYLSSQWALSILGRTSAGPTASVFDPASLGVIPTPATKVVGYPVIHPTLGGIVNGQCDTSSGPHLYDCSSKAGGLVFPTVGRSVLFFGHLGTPSNYCYGIGTSDPNLPHTDPTYCYDPLLAAKGQHAYPYTYTVWAYDVNDLIAAKNGSKNYWDVLPYTTWSLTFPINSGGWKIVGSAYDAVNQRIFLAQQYGDGDGPLIHVLKIQSGGPAGLCR
jgi:hypothetical protein